METKQWINDEGFILSTDNTMIDVTKLYKYLSEIAYWSLGISLIKVQRSIKNSLNFSLLNSSKEFIGFSRIITDFATFAYLSDVFILEEYKKMSLGTWMIKSIMDWNKLKGLRTWFLVTKDAHNFYKNMGWEMFDKCDWAMSYMEIQPNNSL